MKGNLNDECVFIDLDSLQALIKPLGKTLMFCVFTFLIFSLLINVSVILHDAFSSNDIKDDRNNCSNVALLTNLAIILSKTF